MNVPPVVLVIDDDSMFRKTLEAVFPRLGLEVRTTASPSEFLVLSNKLRPDLYIIDLQLTDTTGFELISQLRAANPRTPILVVSGVQGTEAVTHALEVGANDFILKPLDRVLLASKLSRYVDTASLRENRAHQVEAPEGRAPARLTFGVEFTEIDELGVALESPHLIPKGTVFRVKTSFFQQIGSPIEELLATIASTSFNPETGRYTAYAEFDEPPPELAETLRRWIAPSAKSEASDLV